MIRSGRLLRAILSAGAVAWSLPAIAQSTAPTDASQQAPESAGPNFFTGLFAPSRTNLLGSMGGLRDVLGSHGITLNITDAETLLGNVSGGIKQGATMQGLTTVTLQLDTGKAFGLPNGTFNVSALQIHGNNHFDASYLGTIQTTNGNEAENATRLWELWYDQSFLEGRFDIKFGQQSLDQEFIVSKYSGTFINTMMGWPALPSTNLYAGGPAYPLSSLGVRLRGKPTPNLTVLTGVFDDNPPGGPFDNDPQSLDAGGTKFSLRTGALVIAEVQYAVNQPALGQMEYGAGSSGLPGTYKLGFWYDTASFPDQEFDNTGLSLADPDSTGMAALHHGNYSFYGVMDQMVWREAPGSSRSIGVFLRAMGAPAPQNFLTFSANGGFVLSDPLPGRDNDSLGLGFGVVKVSSAVSALDRQTNFFTGVSFPVRGTETFLELTYQFQAAPWWVIQPDFQYIFDPGAGIPNPNNPTTRVHDAAVLGVRTIVTF
jgi:porin